MEVDYRGHGPFPLRFERHYNSDSGLIKGAPPSNWRHTFSREVVLHEAVDMAAVERPSGNAVIFQLSGGQWVPDADVADRLEEIRDATGVRTGWRFIEATEDDVEEYDIDGRLVSVTRRSGLSHILAHVQGRLASVSDSFGRSLAFTYDSQGRISTLVDPAGAEYRYMYTSENNFASVEHPDGRGRTYIYNEPAYTQNTNQPRSLTGVVDENGNRFASFGYDNLGRALSSEHGTDGADKVTLTYTSNLSTVARDARGTTRTLGFQRIQGVKRVRAISQPCEACGSRSAAITYDPNGNAASRTDFNGSRTDFSYNLSRNLETQRLEGLTATGAPTAATRTIATEWHPSFRLPARIAEPKRITTYTYDGAGNLTERRLQATTDATGALGFSAPPTGAPRVWTYTYNGNGQVISIDGPRTDVADVTTYGYDAQGNLTSVTNALGHVTAITSYDAHGKPLTIVDPNGLTTTLSYDVHQRLTARTVGAETTSYEYDGAGQLTRVTLPDGSHLEYRYDAAHRLTAITDSLGNRIAYTLDTMGNRIKEEVFDPAGVLAHAREREYDGLNRLVKDIGGADPAAQVTRYAYDAQGNLTSITDPLNHVTAQAFDALNRLAIMVDPQGGETHYGYDGLDQLTQVTDPRGLTTAYGMSGLGTLDSLVSPDTGASANIYDAAGNLLTSTDARGVVASYSYDALNRVTQVSFTPPAGSGLAPVTQTYIYDQGTNGIGRLTGVTDSSGSTLYAYDQHGRVTNETRTIGGRSYTTASGYDSAGRMIAMTLPSGRTLGYGLDALGRVNSIATSLNGQAQSVIASVTYRPFGPVQALTFGNGQNYTRAFDLDNRITDHTAGGASVTLTYDASSRITALAEGSASFNYSYDELDRLTGFTSPQSSQSFAYDAAGNRTAQTIGANSYAYSYPRTSNRLQSVSGPTARSYGYDAAGNPLSDGRSYSYDARGRLIQAGGFASASYGVNALGQRVTKTLAGGSIVFHYDLQGRLIAETDVRGNPQKEYVWLDDLPVAAITTAPVAASCPLEPTLDPGTSFQPFNALERLEVRSGRPGPRGWEWRLGVNTRQAGQFARANLHWVSNRSYDWTLRYDAQGAGTITVLDGSRRLFTRTWNVAGKPLRTGNALHFTVKASSVPVGNLIAVTLTRINGTSVNTTLQTDGSGEFSKDQVFFVGTALAQGFVVQGTIQLTFTGRHPPKGTRLQFLVNAGTVSCTQAGAPTSDIAYIEPDHLNSPHTVTDSQGRVIWKWDQQDPFGANPPSEDPDGDGNRYTLNLRFPGQYFDAETGLHYNYYRDYDPQTGRYLQSDPIGLDGGLNLYAYADSDPTAYFDALGLQRNGGRVRVPRSTRNLFEEEDILSEYFPRVGEQPAYRPIRIETGGPNACGQCFEIIAIVPVSGTSRSAHRRTANEELIYRAENWPSYRKYLEEQLGSNFIEQMRGGSSGYRNPPSTEWHHPVGSPDVVWLVRRCEHRDPTLQDLLHPGGVGGYGRYYGQ